MRNSVVWAFTGPRLLANATPTAFAPGSASGGKIDLIGCWVRDPRDSVTSVKGLPVGHKSLNCTSCVGRRRRTKDRACRCRRKRGITGGRRRHGGVRWPEMGGERRPAIFIVIPRSRHNPKIL